jgi:hypothetical protein
MRLALPILLAAVACGGGQSGDDGFRPKSRCEKLRPPTGADLKGLDKYAGGGTLKVLEVDVDGDRSPDRLVSSSGLCDRFGNCGYRIYLMRGSCGHALGSVWAHNARSGAPGDRALGDLVATTRDSKGEFEEWYQWQKDRYACKAFRERQVYQAGRLDPAATWGPWEGCAP